MLAELVPDVVVAVERFHDDDDAPLYPEEEVHVARAVAKRRREFATARLCARQAMGRLGLPPVPILPGPRGAPQWPEGVVGSMTHCAGYRAAALGRAGEVVGIGIDAEPNEELPEGVLDAVASPAEQARLRELAAARADVAWPRLLFCAKEAVYKVWFPLTLRWLDFLEADVTLREDGTFTARLLVPGVELGPAGPRLDAFEGTWLARDGLALAAIVV
jgi:4'-phosphopantetheinyl transferase EntD